MAKTVQLSYVIGLFSFMLLMLLVFCVLRLALLFTNLEHAGSTSFQELLTAFAIGLRFDLRMAAYACLPMVLIGVIRAPVYRSLCLYWYGFLLTTYVLMGFIELEFYREFQQRLNGLVLQYLKEDFATVMAMVWQGLPVLSYTLGWIIISLLLWKLVIWLDQKFFGRILYTGFANLPVVALLALVLLIAARGTLRSGPPLRWGDAYHSENIFLNHLALNGSFTLIKAAIYDNQNNIDSHWLRSLPSDQALTVTRSLLVGVNDRIVDEERVPVRRISPAFRTGSKEPMNVVIILLESFSGRYVGALGNKAGVTPEFDSLSEEGVLFTRFFSNGTHTHQGIFATLSCFPNLPGYEYLMQQPEGRNAYSGFTRLYPDYKSKFVYNGDFNWDNQLGYFRNQGFETFIGRYEYKNPVFIDPVWGVSDEDMFNRGAEEFKKLESEQPFYLVLQSLSNHLPYNLPKPLKFEPVTDQEEMSERLTAMKYSDWALGEFFRKIKDTKAYQNTLFVILGDHGFGVKNQLTEIVLLRFHVPLLILGPGLKEKYGSRIHRVGSQVDVIPTLIGQLGGNVRHQCWGRDLLNLSEEDRGFAIIKPSGNEDIIAIVEDSSVLTWDHQRGSHLYKVDLDNDASAELLKDEYLQQTMTRQLLAYIQVAMKSMLDNRTGN